MQDIREALDDKNLDAVTVATCNHWHSLITIWACQAGKDVYVEKPISHNVFEGRKCVEAAAEVRPHRAARHAAAQRANRAKRDRRRAVGQVRQAAGLEGLLLQAAVEHRHASPRTQPPAELDFNIWLGPAPEQPYHDNLVPYNWHWFWDTGNGDIGNQGVHEMDVARWAIPDATLPKRVWSLGGRFVPEGEDQGQTPNMQMAVFDFGDALLVFEVRGLVGQDRCSTVKVGNEFYTTEGVIRDDTWEVDGKKITDFRFHPKNGGEPELLTGGEAEVTPGRTVRCLHRGRAQRRSREEQLRCGSGPLLRSLVPPGQHLLSPGAAAAVPAQAETGGRQRSSGRVARGPRRKSPCREYSTGRIQHAPVRSGHREIRQ